MYVYQAFRPICISVPVWSKFYIKVPLKKCQFGANNHIILPKDLEKCQTLTVSCKQLEPLFFIDYSTNMYSRKTMPHARLCSMLNIERVIQEKRGPIFRKQLYS